MGLRRAMARPPVTELPIPGLGRRVDLAKVLACVALRELFQDQPTVAVKDLAAHLQLEHSTASRLMGEAEEEGLVVRTADPSDRRRTTVALTETGERVVDGATAAQSAFLSILLSDWPDTDVAELARLLERLRHTVEERRDGLHELAMDAWRHAEGLHPQS
jgi:DNA-binding MarR family transcriptional regulator